LEWLLAEGSDRKGKMMSKIWSGVMAGVVVMAAAGAGGCNSTGSHPKDDDYRGITAFGWVWQLDKGALERESEPQADQWDRGITAFGWVWQLDKGSLERSDTN
jgi:hypothetical protein